MSLHPASITAPHPWQTRELGSSADLQLFVLRTSILNNKLHHHSASPPEAPHPRTTDIRVLGITPALSMARQEGGSTEPTGLRSDQWQSHAGSHTTKPKSSVTSQSGSSPLPPPPGHRAHGALGPKPTFSSSSFPPTSGADTGVQHDDGGAVPTIQQQYQESLRQRERAWRQWANAPLARHDTRTRSDDDHTIPSPQQRRQRAEYEANEERERQGRSLGQSACGGELGHVCVAADHVMCPHPATLPFYVLGGPTHSAPSDRGQGARPNAYHIPLTLESGYHATATTPLQTSGGSLSVGAMRLSREKQKQGGPRAADAVSAFSPLLSLSEQLGVVHDERYHQLKQRLHELQPDMWYRALPSYAALDATPQLMDADVNLSFSRVARCAQDSGAVVV